MTVYLPETYRKDYEFYIADTDPTRVKDGITLLLKRHHIEARSRNLKITAVFIGALTIGFMAISPSTLLGYGIAIAASTLSAAIIKRVITPKLFPIIVP